MADASDNQAVILDLGKQKRKKVKKLRKGKGKLMDKVNEAVEELRQHGVIADDAQTVVVVVERKRKKKSTMMGMPMPFNMD